MSLLCEMLFPPDLTETGLCAGELAWFRVRCVSDYTETVASSYAADLAPGRKYTKVRLLARPDGVVPLDEMSETVCSIGSSWNVSTYFCVVAVEADLPEWPVRCLSVYTGLSYSFYPGPFP